ncbi:hypothetical protein [Pseudomonas gingeri]
MIAMRLVVLSLTLVLSANAAAAPKTLKKGSLICESEDLYDKQVKYIVQRVNKILDGCGFTKKAYKVVILDLNMFSASEVQVIEQDMTVWTAHESLSN